MNKKRLLKLADLLEADASNRRGIKFNLSTVITPSEKLPANAKAIPVSCGTQACAMGLAAISGAFKRQGLSYRMEHNEEYGIQIDTTMFGNDMDYDDAAMELFEITYEEAHFLFTPSSYEGDDIPIIGARGERYVAKRIRDFVAGKASPPIDEDVA